MSSAPPKDNYYKNLTVENNLVVGNLIARNIIGGTIESSSTVSTSVTSYGETVPIIISDPNSMIASNQYNKIIWTKTGNIVNANMIIITQTPPGSVSSPLNFSFKAPEGTPVSPIMGTGLFYNGSTMYPAMVIYNPLEFPNVYVQIDNAITTFTTGNVLYMTFTYIV